MHVCASLPPLGQTSQHQSRQSPRCWRQQSFICPRPQGEPALTLMRLLMGAKQAARCQAGTGVPHLDSCPAYLPPGLLSATSGTTVHTISLLVILLSSMSVSPEYLCTGAVLAEWMPPPASSTPALPPEFRMANSATESLRVILGCASRCLWSLPQRGRLLPSR